MSEPVIVVGAGLEPFLACHHLTRQCPLTTVVAKDDGPRQHGSVVASRRSNLLLGPLALAGGIQHPDLPQEFEALSGRCGNFRAALRISATSAAICPGTEPEMVAVFILLSSVNPRQNPRKFFGDFSRPSACSAAWAGTGAAAALPAPPALPIRANTDPQRDSLFTKVPADVLEADFAAIAQVQAGQCVNPI